MRYCSDQGMPHSDFLAWDSKDRAKQMAVLLEDAITCPSCGTAEWEWDPEQGGHKYAYQPIEHICRGCELKELGRSEESHAGKYVTLKPRGS